MDGKASHRFGKHISVKEVLFKYIKRKTRQVKKKKKVMKNNQSVRKPHKEDIEMAKKHMKKMFSAIKAS